LKSQKGAKKKDSSSDDSSFSDSDQEELRTKVWMVTNEASRKWRSRRTRKLTSVEEPSNTVQYEYREGQADQLVTMTSIQGLTSARAELGLLSQK